MREDILRRLSGRLFRWLLPTLRPETGAVIMLIAGCLFVGVLPEILADIPNMLRTKEYGLGLLLIGCLAFGAAGFCVPFAALLGIRFKPKLKACHFVTAVFVLVVCYGWMGSEYTSAVLLHVGGKRSLYIALACLSFTQLSVLIFGFVQMLDHGESFDRLFGDGRISWALLGGHLLSLAVAAMLMHLVPAMTRPSALLLVFNMLFVGNHIHEWIERSASPVGNGDDEALQPLPPQTQETT